MNKTIDFSNKKVLIVSHNPLSKFSNNGKTIASIFGLIPLNNIFQIFLNDDLPDFESECHYLQLNEKQIVTSILTGKNICCQEVEIREYEKARHTIKIFDFKFNFLRLIREFIWKSNLWKTHLKKWLNGKNFDAVFFVGGDGGFAYEVYKFAVQNAKCNGFLFFTDDYIMTVPMFLTLSRLRRFLLLKKINSVLPLTKKVFVISEEMQKAYLEFLGINSIIIRNYTKNFTNDNFILNKENKNVVFVYAGGLHLNRWKILQKLAQTIKAINESNNLKCILKIYSHQSISKKIVRKLNVENASIFCGAVDQNELINVFSSSDVLVHVESFKKKYIKSTKYSFSTKIPEYLSANKCVLAIGPEEISSIKYLSECACIVNKKNNLYNNLYKLINNEEYREIIREKCFKKYKSDFSDTEYREILSLIFSNN